jgi:hypothetical protein
MSFVNKEDLHPQVLRLPAYVAAPIGAAREELLKEEQ